MRRELWVFNPRNRHNHQHSTDVPYLGKDHPRPLRTASEREQEKADRGITDHLRRALRGR